MRPLSSLSLIAILVLGLSVSAAPQKHDEYFTDSEIDLIRDAQELQLRVQLFFQLADRRLFFLGVKEKTEKQIEEDRKLKEKRQKEADKTVKANGPRPTEPVDPDAYLADFTRSDLLRGYVEAIDEAMNNIDDAYQRKFGVREALEALEKYTRDTLPLLEKYQAKGSEQVGLEMAIDKTQEALDGAREALKTVPKTEKKSTQP